MSSHPWRLRVVVYSLLALFVATTLPMLCHGTLHHHEIYRARLDDVLRDFADAQQEYFETHGRYTADASILRFQGVVRVLTATESGWSAIAADSAETCTARVGSEFVPTPGAVEGEPVCGTAPETGGVSTPAPPSAGGAPGGSAATGRPAQHVPRFAALSVGSHACGLTSAGTAYCWGANRQGQLGNGSFIARSVPSPVAGGLIFTAVSVGDYHTCGVTAAGAVYCWGSNDHGQLGNGSTTSSTTPVAVAPGIAFRSVSAGMEHSCGVATGGVAYCWGQNMFGQLGDGSTTDRLVAVEVAQGLAFTAISAGEEHTCGLTLNGRAYCWGDIPSARTTTPTPVGGGLKFVEVSVGRSVTCGVTTARAAYCWGWNRYGQLGDGSTTDRSDPALVAGGLRFVAVYPGAEHACGLTTDGTAWCWGTNEFDQLGADTAAGLRGRTLRGCCSQTPIRVRGVPTFATLSVGKLGACGRTSRGIVYCWGATQGRPREVGEPQPQGPSRRGER